MSQSEHAPRIARRGGAYLPVAVAVGGVATYAAMDAGMKGLSIALGVYNALLWRMLAAVALAGLLYAWRGGGWPARHVLLLYLRRGVIIAIMATLFFWGLVHVPLAEAIALSFIAPLIAMYLARALLHEPIGPRAVMASTVGFTGALVIVGGKLGGDYGGEVWQGYVAILLSALLYAYNLILQRQQAILARPIDIGFFQNAVVFLIYLLFAPFLAAPPPVEFYPALVGTAVLGLASMMSISWAYARAEARILIPVEYTAFIWAALLGWLMFGEALTLATLVGTALIVVGCLLAARQ